MNPSSTSAPSIPYLIQSVVRYLSFRSRSRQEILHYLTKKVGSANQSLIPVVMAKIDHFNILNDAQFAQEFAQSQLNRGKGARYIAYALKLKGLTQDLIKATITSLDPDTVNQSAKKVVLKILPSWGEQDQSVLKTKAAHYLYNRGFTQRTIETVIDDCLPYKVK